MLKIRKITEVRTTANLMMLLRFETGEIRLIDFKTIIPLNTSFEDLKNPTVFMQAESQKTAVRWEDINIDIAASDLYEVSHPVDLESIKITTKK